MNKHLGNTKNEMRFQYNHTDYTTGWLCVLVHTYLPHANGYENALPIWFGTAVKMATKRQFIHKRMRTLNFHIHMYIHLYTYIHMYIYTYLCMENQFSQIGNGHKIKTTNKGSVLFVMNGEFESEIAAEVESESDLRPVKDYFSTKWTSLHIIFCINVYIHIYKLYINKYIHVCMCAQNTVGINRLTECWWWILAVSTRKTHIHTGMLWGLWWCRCHLRGFVDKQKCNTCCYEWPFVVEACEPLLRLSNAHAPKFALTSCQNCQWRFLFSFLFNERSWNIDFCRTSSKLMLNCCGVKVVKP